MCICDMPIYGLQRYRYRVCGILVSGGQALSYGLLFSHSMLLGIGYRFHGFVDVPSDRVSGVGYFVALLLSYPMSLAYGS